MNSDDSSEASPRPVLYSFFRRCSSHNIKQNVYKRRLFNEQPKHEHFTQVLDMLRRKGKASAPKATKSVVADTVSKDAGSSKTAAVSKDAGTSKAGTVAKEAGTSKPGAVPQDTGKCKTGAVIKDARTSRSGAIPKTAASSANQSRVHVEPKKDIPAWMSAGVSVTARAKRYSSRASSTAGPTAPRAAASSTRPPAVSAAGSVTATRAAVNSARPAAVPAAGSATAPRAAENSTRPAAGPAVSSATAPRAAAKSTRPTAGPAVSSAAGTRAAAKSTRPAAAPAASSSVATRASTRTAAKWKPATKPAPVACIWSPTTRAVEIIKPRTTYGRAKAATVKYLRQLLPNAHKAETTCQRETVKEEVDQQDSEEEVPWYPHRAADAHVDPETAAILFRRARGLLAHSPYIAYCFSSNVKEDESQIFSKFYKLHSCYTLIPTSAKLVVLDTELLVKKSLEALVYNGVRAAPLWNSAKQSLVGVLTVTDFIKILLKCNSGSDVSIEDLEHHKLSCWLKLLNNSLLVSIDPEASLYEAIDKLISHKIHRLPIVEPESGNCLYILTHKRILAFLFLYIEMLPLPSYLNRKIGELRVGTYANIETARHETLILEALKKLVDRRVSALPVVDEEGRLLDIYAKFDVMNLAEENKYKDLSMTLNEANKNRNVWFEGVKKCTLNDTLYEVMKQFVVAEVHRLIVVDGEDKVIGIISLSDILAYIVIRPPTEADLEAADYKAFKERQNSTVGSTKESDLYFSSIDESLTFPVMTHAIESIYDEACGGLSGSEDSYCIVSPETPTFDPNYK